MAERIFIHAVEKLDKADCEARASLPNIDFHEQQVPDAATLLKYRHMLEKNKIDGKIFADVNKCLDEAGLMMHQKHSDCLGRMIMSSIRKTWSLRMNLISIQLSRAIRSVKGWEK